MSKIFNQIGMKKVGRNAFDLSHDIKYSFNMGELIPTAVMDVLPGDTFRIRPENMLRFAPLVAPVMHRVLVKTNYFFVPNRLLWDKWEDFITGNDEIEPPYFQITPDMPTSSLGDYMGLPLHSTRVDGLDVSAFPFAAYTKIWDEYYRDQNLQTERFIPLADGIANSGYITIAEEEPYRRAWQHDYFTSALPFAQKGDAVTLPLLANGSSDVTLKTGLDTAGPPVPFYRSTTGTPLTSASLFAGTNGTFGPNIQAGGLVGRLDPNGTLEVDINAEASTIATLRTAFKAQEWLEKNARAGSRYIESIYAHFGIKSKDARLQRPEYIGGMVQNMTISEVLSTADTTETPVGGLAGHGISVGAGGQFNYTATEHGWIMGLISVVPDTAYQQGLPKMFSRTDKFDYFWPTFAHIGEQEININELYTDYTSLPEGAETFGYIPRYAEYRFISNRVAGDFRNTLEFWHLGRKFDSLPLLNESFIECNPSRRIFAVTSEDVNTIYAHTYNRVQAIRKIPKFGIPTI